MNWADGTGLDRECVLDAEGNKCGAESHYTDSQAEDSAEVPLQTHTLREFEQHLTELKKENFSLKLRIYFLEERIQQKYEESSDEVYRRNIELKVQVESLKQELQETQLERTRTTTDGQNEAELRCEERQIQQDSHLSCNKTEAVDDSHSVLMQTRRDERDLSEDSVDRESLEQDDQVLMISELMEERDILKKRLRQMEDELLQKERDAEFYQEQLGQERLHLQQEMQTLAEEQQAQLDRYECAAGQCVDELQKAQLQVESLQNKIHESETSNKELEQKLCEMESQFKSIRLDAQDQERTIQNLTDMLRSQGAEKSSSALDQLRRSLISCELELETSRTAHIQSQRHVEDLLHSRARLENELQDALHQGDATNKHNQELRQTVEHLESELQVKTCQVRECDASARSEIAAQDRLISQLQEILQQRDALLQECSELLDPPCGQRDLQLDMLRRRVRERDGALQRLMDEKFQCLEEKECVLMRLQQTAREKDHDLERLRHVLSNNTETITGLNALLQKKELDLKQAQKILSNLKHQGDEKHIIVSQTVHTQETKAGMSEYVGELLDHCTRTRDQDMEDRGNEMVRLMSEPSAQIQELQQHLWCREQELEEVKCERDTAGARELQRLQQLLQEKDLLIQEMRQNQISGISHGVCSGDLEDQQESEIKHCQMLTEALRSEKNDSQTDRCRNTGTSIVEVVSQRRREGLNGDSCTQEEEDEDGVDGSSEDFTDSIEDVIAQSSSQEARVSDSPVSWMEMSQTTLEVDQNIEGDESEKIECPSPAHTRNVQTSLSGKGQAHNRRRTGENSRCQAMLQVNNTGQREARQRSNSHTSLREEEEDTGAIGGALGKRGPPCVKQMEGGWKRRRIRPHSLDLGSLLSRGPAANNKAQVEHQSTGRCAGGIGTAVGIWSHEDMWLLDQSEHLRSVLETSRDLQERLMVSEATVQAQAEQLKDYRDLLTESTVQQDSKQIQVDLQDLGYETSGRSENEAERYDTSSPELDEWDGLGRGRCAKDAASPLVKDLRAQLSHCHRAIRGLQQRVRTLSITSDYASSPSKLNWTTRCGVADDELWQSDEWQDLLTRVEMLEIQMKSSRLERMSRPEEGRFASWPGKYNTLIQAQARELSHLRQKMKEGRGISHILTQHLSDTTKAFEELLRANDIDYYMGQSFRGQLSQTSSLAQRLQVKIGAGDDSEPQDDKTGHELLALRLSKELQHKNQIIESLHTKLKHCPDTPCSSHALSESTDQSEHICSASDDGGFSTEDVNNRSVASPGSAKRFTIHSQHAPRLGRCTSVPSSTMQNESSVLWEKENLLQPFRGLDVSSCFPGVDVTEKHLREIRSLRHVLEDSIRNNETLRQQLETRLNLDASSTNISIQGQETFSQLTVSGEESLLSGQTRLKRAELEAEQLNGALRKMQAHNLQQSHEIQQLRQERQRSQEQEHRLQHEAGLLQQQLLESRQMLRALQCRLQLSPPAGLGCEFQELLVEVRAVRAQLEQSVQENGALRAQLQKQLWPSTAFPTSPLRDVLCRRQLLHDPSPSPPVRDIGPFPGGPLCSPFSELEESNVNANDTLDTPHSDLETFEGSFASRNGGHVMGQVEDYSALLQQVLEGRALVQQMETSLSSGLMDISSEKGLDYNTLKMLHSDTKTLRQILEEAASLLKMFGRAALPSTESPGRRLQKEQSMHKEIQALRLRISQQEEVLQGTIQRLRRANKTNESMEIFIVSQLSRTRDVVRKARQNLEGNKMKISSLSFTSSSLCRHQNTSSKERLQNLLVGVKP